MCVSCGPEMNSMEAGYLWAAWNEVTEMRTIWTDEVTKKR